MNIMFHICLSHLVHIAVCAAMTIAVWLAKCAGAQSTSTTVPPLCQVQLGMTVCQGREHNVQAETPLMCSLLVAFVELRAGGSMLYVHRPAKPSLYLFMHKLFL